MPAPAEGLDLLPIVAPADNPTDGNDNDVKQQMPLAAVKTGILEFAKVLLDGEMGLGHDLLREDGMLPNFPRRF